VGGQVFKDPQEEWDRLVQWDLLAQLDFKVHLEGLVSLVRKEILDLADPQECLDHLVLLDFKALQDHLDHLDRKVIADLVVELVSREELDHQEVLVHVVLIISNLVQQGLSDLQVPQEERLPAQQDLKDSEETPDHLDLLDFQEVQETVVGTVQMVNKDLPVHLEVRQHPVRMRMNA